MFGYIFNNNQLKTGKINPIRKAKTNGKYCELGPNTFTEP